MMSAEDAVPMEKDGLAKTSSRVQLTQALIDQYFPGIADPTLRSCIEHALAIVHSEHRTYQDGPLRQVLLIAYLDPVAREEGGMQTGGRAVLRLQLANGILHELRLQGCIERATARLEEIAAWLALQEYDSNAFECNRELVFTLINSGHAGQGICKVEMVRYASIAPPPSVSERMTLKMALAALNLLRNDYGLEPIQDAPQLLVDHVASVLSDARRSIQRYVAGLDPSVLAVIRDFHLRHHYRYDDLNVYNFLAVENRHSRRNRIQAVTELPWLLRVLSGMDRIHSYDTNELPPSRRTNPRAVTEIIDAIDTGKPLFDAIAKAFCVPRETVRWSRHRMLPHVGQFAVTRMDLLFTMLSWLPPEKRPVTGEDWHSMRMAISELLPVFHAYWDDHEIVDEITTDPRYGVVMARWLRELSRPTLDAALERIERMIQAGDGPEDLKDFLKALLRGLRRFCLDDCPGMPSRLDPYLGALLDWLASRQLSDVIAVSRRWHEAMHAYLLQQCDFPPPKTGVGSVRWVAVLLHPVHVKSLSIVELTDSRSLEDEGRIMGHCVAGYSARCYREDAMIVSVRDIDGRRLSTAELAIQVDPIRVTLRQHKGRKNAPPPEQCEAAISGLIERLHRPEFRTLLIQRWEFQKTRRARYVATQDMRASDADRYQRIEEIHAWTCAFGSPPCENPVSLGSIIQRRG